jgi:hypothetical protein
MVTSVDAEPGITWKSVFRRSRYGRDVYCLHETEDLDGDCVEVTVVEGGGAVISSARMLMPRDCAAALPGGAMYRLTDSCGFFGCQEGTWIIGVRALRHVLRLLDIVGPGRRLHGEQIVPGEQELAREWAVFTQQSRETLVASAIDWLHLGPGGNDVVRAQPPFRFPADADKRNPPAWYRVPAPWDESDLTYGWDSNPRVPEAYFWSGSVTAWCSDGAYRVSAKGLGARRGEG